MTQDCRKLGKIYGMRRLEADNMDWRASGGGGEGGLL